MIKKQEFENSLREPLSFWQNKSRDEVRDLLGNAVAQMIGFAQNNPHHCYDLFLHTLHAVDEIGSSYPTVLRTAAFFHDIGKPCVAFEKQGRTVFYGHAQESAQIAAPILAELGYSAREIELICFYITHHDDFISWILPAEKGDRQNPYQKEITLKNVGAHLKKVMRENALFEADDAKCVWLNLMELCRADASAQAEFVYKNGTLIDSRAHKMQKAGRIREIVSEFFAQ